MSEKTKGHLATVVLVLVALLVWDVLNRLFLSSTLDNLLPASYEAKV